MSKAAEQYEAKLAEAREQLKRIESLLNEHSEKQADQPGHWGFAGDMGHVVSELGNVESFLKGQE